jgi:hypothetical protein
MAEFRNREEGVCGMMQSLERDRKADVADAGFIQT